MTDKQPDALRLAALLEKTGARGSLRDQAAAELRRLHAYTESFRSSSYAARLEIESLKKRVQELGQMARDVNSRRVVELESELAVMQALGEPVAFMHDVPGRFDVIHAAVKKLLHDANDAAGHLLRPLDKSERYTIPLYTYQPAAQDAERKRWIEIGQAIERACMTLPEGAEVILSLERDAGTVKWFDGDGNEYDTESHEDGLAGVINDAIDAAIAAQQGEKE